MFWSPCSLTFFGLRHLLPLTPLIILLPPTLSSYLANRYPEYVITSSFPKPILLALVTFSTYWWAGNHLCPVLALQPYLAHHGLLAGPFFIWSVCSPLTADQVSHYLCLILSRAGVSGQFSSHSFRIGAATSAAAPDLSDQLIQTFARWTCQAYRHYIPVAPGTLLPCCCKVGDIWRRLAVTFSKCSHFRGLV